MKQYWNFKDLRNEDSYVHANAPFFTGKVTIEDTLKNWTKMFNEKLTSRRITKGRIEGILGSNRTVDTLTADELRKIPKLISNKFGVSILTAQTELKTFLYAIRCVITGKPPKSREHASSTHQNSNPNGSVALEIESGDNENLNEFVEPFMKGRFLEAKLKLLEAIKQCPVSEHRLIPIPIQMLNNDKELTAFYSAMSQTIAHFAPDWRIRLSRTKQRFVVVRKVDWQKVNPTRRPENVATLSNGNGSSGKVGTSEEENRGFGRSQVGGKKPLQLGTSSQKGTHRKR